jgi:hypothetical protein
LLNSIGNLILFILTNIEKEKLNVNK